MDITIYPQKLKGAVAAIPSKSQAHRLLICAAFADKPTVLRCPDSNRDIEATAGCLRGFGAEVVRTDTGYLITPVKTLPRTATLPCAESGSTLRFLLPVAGALGVDTTFLLEGRLPQRPLSPLWEEMERMGCTLSRPSANSLRCTGRLKSGNYTIAGNISSQFITGLLLGCSLMDGTSTITVTGKLESKPYVDMTLNAMTAFGSPAEGLRIHGGRFHSPGEFAVEGDWSNAAFFLAARSLGCDVAVTNLNPFSPQGDKAIAALLPLLESRTQIDATDIPDLVPILSVAAAAKKGAVFIGIHRLRLKESDRVASVLALLHSLGIQAEASEDTMIIHPGSLTGGTVDAFGDHRIAMAAAIAATAASGPVTISGAQCVSKSYPHFWEDYKKLGGLYEFDLR